MSWTTGSASGQTVDASFQPTTLYSPSDARAAVTQPDGKRLVVGQYTRTDAGVGTQLLVRYNADNTVDQAFAANVASLRGYIYNVRVLTSGKLLLVGDGTITLNGLTRQDLMRLNADGTADASFNAGLASGNSSSNCSAVQPDGKLLIGGDFTSYNGVAVKSIVRLQADGAVDPTFNADTPSGSYALEITLQPDGKILVGFYYGGIVRLLPNGATDTGFTPPADVRRVTTIGVQPDGRILIGYKGPGRSTLIRVMPSGALDPTFTAPGRMLWYTYESDLFDGEKLVVEPDGHILVALEGPNNGTTLQTLVRLNTDGTLATSFNSPLLSLAEKPEYNHDDFGYKINSIQLQANGQVLVAGRSFRLPGRRNAVVLLNANGTLDSAFNPVLLEQGSVSSVAQQTDGKLIVGGYFDEVNGVRATNLARFNADGSVDAAFTGLASPRFTVSKVKLQPDGKILLQGINPVTTSNTDRQLDRLLTTGAPDNTFQPVANTSVYTFCLLSDGRIVINDNYPGRVSCLLATGQPDPTFTPLTLTEAAQPVITELPNGKILVSGYFYEVMQNGYRQPLKSIIRLQPNGLIDPSFSSPVQQLLELYTLAMVVQPDGKIVLGTYFRSSEPATVPYGLFRLLPDGANDPTFTATPPIANGYGAIWAFALQPNGRILFSANGQELGRLLPNGQADPSFGAVTFGSVNFFTTPGYGGGLNDILMQSDGNIVVGGYFNTVNGQPTVSLARLTAPNVLHVASAQLEARTQAWPVPAHETLNLSLDAAAQPESVQLLDNLGRTVLRQSVAQAELSVPLRQVKAGVYLLRVNYANGPVTRRVVVE
ncbi:T9SS type A sorting domain-containing protein [Hymenobacter cellulosivorans]|uniref:T9SS type A sorting domain-containing protein n=1 Tax=Hymenobacter cellulosivorans TaxID=2932249 RepID=A0ABY4FCN3_9BACT|nr:T9SS type A sorting domain-containing protein [Hymenobacter cellulosivorans]UOQ54414.1 T9SS type A sorting domain-containing protein [Hymenobacter cellulosivorans]